jgi:hypothetical protein
LGGEAQLDELRPWSVRAGGEWGSDGSRGSTASLDYSGLALEAGVSGLHSDAPDKSAGTVTSSGRAYVKYGSNILKGGVAFDSTSDESLRHSQRWTGSLDLTLSGWAAGLNVATRKTLFDSFPADVVSRPRAGEVLDVLTNADCSLHDMEYGGSLGYNAAGWSVYASGAWSDYGNVSCGYDHNVANVSGGLSRAQFQQLAGAFLSRAVARAGGRIGDDTRLLSSQVGAGAAHHWERFSLSVDYSRSQDEFGGAIQNGYSLTGTFVLNSRFSLDITAGATSGNQTASSSWANASGATPYAGAYLTVSF